MTLIPSFSYRLSPMTYRLQEDTEPSWQADLDRFRATCATQRRTIAGHEWEYVRRGFGPAAVLVLPGGLAVAETAFRYIGRLESRYPVIAPTYPETIARMADLIDGLIMLLRAEQIERINIVGGSYSGLVAQCLVRRAPAMIDRLVLADTGVPRRWRACQFAIYRGLASALPLWALRGLAGFGVWWFARQLPAQRDFWRSYFGQRAASLSRAALVSHLAIWHDFDRSYRFGAHDLAGWHGRMLIIAAENDGLFRPSEQLALQRLYPAARAHMLAPGTHGASLARMDEYIALIEQFLAGT